MNSPALSPRRLPPWLKVELPRGENYERIKAVSRRRSLATVCEEARCPNISECWGGGTATFMVMGESCTRGCRFCSVAPTANPGALDPQEPQNLAETLSEMKLDYAVVTTVCRDDLPDQGAGHLAECIRAVKARVPKMLLEVLIPDFQGNQTLLRQVVEAGPDVVSHNLETVERLTPLVRDHRAGYRQSLGVLRFCGHPGESRGPETLDSGFRRNDAVVTKSSLMLGLGETEAELVAAFKDLRDVGVSILTLGQYLRPTSAKRHLPVAEFVSPERFEALGKLAKQMGFLYVASGPFVRSSYRAGELFLKGLLEEKCH